MRERKRERDQLIEEGDVRGERGSKMEREGGREGGERQEEEKREGPIDRGGRCKRGEWEEEVPMEREEGREERNKKREREGGRTRRGKEAGTLKTQFF